jgi:hypothetical protein
MYQAAAALAFAPYVVHRGLLPVLDVLLDPLDAVHDERGPLQTADDLICWLACWLAAAAAAARPHFLCPALLACLQPQYGNTARVHVMCAQLACSQALHQAALLLPSVPMPHLRLLELLLLRLLHRPLIKADEISKKGINSCTGSIELGAATLTRTTSCCALEHAA